MEQTPPHLWSDPSCVAADDEFPSGWVKGLFATHRRELSHCCSLAVVEPALTFQDCSLHIRQPLAGSGGRVNDPLLLSTHHRTHVPFPICQASKVQMPLKGHSNDDKSLASLSRVRRCPPQKRNTSRPRGCGREYLPARPGCTLESGYVCLR
jgi:hypothetical protein